MCEEKKSTPVPFGTYHYVDDLQLEKFKIKWRIEHYENYTR